MKQCLNKESKNIYKGEERGKGRWRGERKWKTERRDQTGVVKWGGREGNTKVRATETFSFAMY